MKYHTEPQLGKWEVFCTSRGEIVQCKAREDRGSVRWRAGEGYSCSLHGQILRGDKIHLHKYKSRSVMRDAASACDGIASASLDTAT